MAISNEKYKSNTSQSTKFASVLKIGSTSVSCLTEKTAAQILWSNVVFDDESTGVFECALEEATGDSRAGLKLVVFLLLQPV